jgi:NAD(P)-dependent dehydrogenase (short-subunit alcohol dehydrogenase family)
MLAVIARRDELIRDFDGISAAISCANGGHGREAEDHMFKSDLLSAKRILVTGGGTGLGKSMSRRFLELGASVVICGRRRIVLEETGTQLASEFPGRIAWYACDIRNTDQIDSMIETIWAARAVDALVNNAAGNFIAQTETLSPRPT